MVKKDNNENFIFQVENISKTEELHWIITLFLLIVLVFFLDIIVTILLPFYKFRPVDLPYISIINFLLRINIGFALIFVIGSILISFEFWRRFGKFFSQKLIVDNFTKERKSKILKFMIWIFGLKIHNDFIYFLEEKIDNINISIKNYPKIFKTRIYEVISTSFGIIFIIVYVLSTILDISIKDNAILVFNIMFILLLISPMLISWIIPLIWVIKDAKIKYQDKNFNIRNLSEDISKGVLSRIIKIAGLFFAISFLIRYNFSLHIPIIESTIFTIFAIIFFLLIITNTSLPVAIIYITKFHKKNVNYVRKRLEENKIPLAKTTRMLTDEQKVLKFREIMNIKKPKEISVSFKVILIIPWIIFIVFFISAFFIEYSRPTYFFLFYLLISINLIIIISSYFILKKRIKKKKLHI